VPGLHVFTAVIDAAPTAGRYLNPGVE